MGSPTDQRIIKMLENSPKGRLVYETGWDKTPHSTLLLVSKIQSETEEKNYQIIERAIRLSSRRSLNETPKRTSFSNELISPRSKTKVRSFTFETQDSKFDRTEISESEVEPDSKSVEKRGYGITDDDEFDLIQEEVEMNRQTPAFDITKTLLLDYTTNWEKRTKTDVNKVKEEYEMHEIKYRNKLRTKFVVIEEKYTEKIQEALKEVGIQNREITLLKERLIEEEQKEVKIKNQLLNQLKEKEKARETAVQLQKKEFEAQKALRAQKEKELKLELEEAKKKAEDAKNQAEALKLQEAENNKLIGESKKNALAKLSVSSQDVPDEFKGCILRGDLDKFVKSQNLLEQVKGEVGHISAQDPQTKQFYFLASKSVNTPLNSLSVISAEHIGSKLVHLVKLLEGGSVLIDEKPFSHTGMPKGELFICNLLANRFVKKSEAEITKGGNFIFPLATLGVNLIAKFPSLAILIQSAFYKHCPFLVPFNFPRNNLSVEQYVATIGHEIKGGESAVTQTLIERLSGYCILYGMMVKQIDEKKIKISGAAANFFTLEEVWRIISVILKLEPQLDVTATVLQSLLDTIGDRLEEIYRKQFLKVLHFIATQFIGKIRSVTPANKVGAISRFEIFLESKVKTGFRKTNLF